MFQVAEYYISINDEDKAILALEAFVLRSKEFGRSAESQHETLVGRYPSSSFVFFSFFKVTGF